MHHVNLANQILKGNNGHGAAGGTERILDAVRDDLIAVTRGRLDLSTWLSPPTGLGVIPNPKPTLSLDSV